MRLLPLLAMMIWMPPAIAADGFDIVIPGRPGVPIIINGIDASYAVIEGDWGLARGTHVQPTIYGGRYIDSAPAVGHYYPSLGHRPRYGRLEIEPPGNRKSRGAESYYRAWSAQSSPLPPQIDVPHDPPPVIVAPQIDPDPPREHPAPGGRKLPR